MNFPLSFEVTTAFVCSAESYYLTNFTAIPYYLTRCSFHSRTIKHRSYLTCPRLH